MIPFLSFLTGITPCKAIFESLRASHAHGIRGIPRRVHLIWVVRDASILNLMKDTLDEFANVAAAMRNGGNDQPFSVQIYIPLHKDDRKSAIGDTTSSPSSTTSLPFDMSSITVHRRPDLFTELTAITNQSEQLPPYGNDIGHDIETPENGRRNSRGSLIPFANAGRTLLFVCGPEQMAADCETIAYARKWDYHTETFEL
jgi:hypothetical protein